MVNERIIASNIIFELGFFKKPNPMTIKIEIFWNQNFKWDLCTYVPIFIKNSLKGEKNHGNSGVASHENLTLFIQWRGTASINHRDYY